MREGRMGEGKGNSVHSGVVSRGESGVAIR